MLEISCIMFQPSPLPREKNQRSDKNLLIHLQNREEKSRLNWFTKKNCLFSNKSAISKGCPSSLEFCHFHCLLSFPKNKFPRQSLKIFTFRFKLILSDSIFFLLGLSPIVKLI